MPRITTATVGSSNGRACAGLKTQTFVQHFTGVDLLVGENGAGKTTRGPLGITAGIEGLAERPTDARRPYVGPPPANTSITLTLDNGAVLVRDLSVTRGKLVDEANMAARKLIGIPPTAWDLRDFATGTDGDRGSVLDAVARAGGAIQSWDMATAIGQVRALHADMMDEGTDPAAWAVPMDQCTRALTAAADGADWLKAAEKWAEAEQVKANAAQKSARSHAEQVAAQAPEKPGHDAAADKARVKELYQERVRLEASGEDRKRAAKDLERHAAEGVRLAAALEATKAEGQRLAVVPQAPDATVPADVLARLREAEEAVTAPIPPPDGSRIADLEVALANAEKKRGEAIKHAEAAGTAASDAQAAMVAALATRNKAADASAATQRDLNTAAATVQALERVISGGVCVHCGEADPLGHGQELEAAQARLQAANEAAAVTFAALNVADDAHAKAEAVYRTADSDRRTAEAAADRVADMMDAARNALEAARKAPAAHDAQVRAARTRGLEAARAAVQREEARITQERARYQDAEDARGNALQAARARYKATAAALADWTASEAPTVPPEPDAEALATITQELADIERRTRAMLSWEQAVEAAKAAMEAADSSRLTWESIKALVSACRKARDELASVAYRPIEESAQGLLRDAEGLPLPFFAGPGDYGAIVPGRGRVPFHGLSESEQRITAAALVFALATVARNPVRLVLLDGIEVVQADHRGPLLAALVRAHRAGLVDNVVMTMATAPGEDLTAYRIDGLTIHHITRQPGDVVEPPSPQAASVTSTLPESETDADCPF